MQNHKDLFKCSLEEIIEALGTTKGIYTTFSFNGSKATIHYTKEPNQVSFIRTYYNPSTQEWEVIAIPTANVYYQNDSTLQVSKLLNVLGSK